MTSCAHHTKGKDFLGKWKQIAPGATGSHHATMKSISLKRMENVGRWKSLAFALREVSESVNGVPAYSALVL